MRFPRDRGGISYRGLTVEVPGSAGSPGSIRPCPRCRPGFLTIPGLDFGPSCNSRTYFERIARKFTPNGTGAAGRTRLAEEGPGQAPVAPGPRWAQVNLPTVAEVW